MESHSSRPPPQLDMTSDGRFIGQGPGPASGLPWSVRILRVALFVTAIAVGLSLAALALWFALIIIPVALVAGAIAYAAFRWRLWQVNGSARYNRGIWRR
jgi:hypothetical protein